MKQQITSLQLKELSEKSYQKLFKWMDDHGCVSRSSTHYPQQWDEKLKGETENVYMPEPNIGQMIEFLDEKDEVKLTRLFLVESFSDSDRSYICDDLWEATKEVLEKI